MPTLRRPGRPKVRTAIAESLNRRFGETFRMDNIFMTCGAAASLNICLKALLNAGEEAITFAPFFPEYRVWVEGVGAALNVIPAKLPDFQIDAEAFEQAITPKTKVVIVNTPNNPSGVVYSEETIRNLCAILKKKSEEYGAPIYLITDEPYREIVYDDIEVPYLTKYYNDTLVCYSYSKSLSLPASVSAISSFPIALPTMGMWLRPLRRCPGAGLCVRPLPVPTGGGQMCGRYRRYFRL